MNHVYVMPARELLHLVATQLKPADMRSQSHVSVEGRVFRVAMMVKSPNGMAEIHLGVEVDARTVDPATILSLDGVQ